MSHLIDLSPNQIRDLVDYNPEIGRFTWRPKSDWRNWKWNAKFAGKLVGTYEKSGSGYMLIAFFRKHYYAHRIAWTHFHGEKPPEGMHIDHINGIRADNRIANLRIATVAQNIQNQGLHADNTSGYKGATFHKPTGKWLAAIKANNTHHYLGLFLTAKEAHEAYAEASKKLHGEFSNLG